MDSIFISFDKFFDIFIKQPFFIILFFSGGMFILSKIFKSKSSLFSIGNMATLFKAFFYTILAVCTVFFDFTNMTLYIPIKVNVTQSLVFVLAAFEAISNIITLFTVDTTKP